MSGVSLKDLLSRMSDDAETLRLRILPNINISPIYLAYDTVTRNLSRETIQRALVREDSDFEAVSAHVREINDVEHSLHQWRVKLHNFLQPVAALPVEVLQKILLHAVAPHKRYIYHQVTQSPIVLSQVCSTWRYVAQSYPPIWTVIRSISGENGPYELHALYSRGLPLESHQYKPYRVESGVNDEIQSRITTLHLEFNEDVDWLEDPTSWSSKLKANCHSIQNLSLFYSRSPFNTRLPVLNDFTSLRHLSLSRIFTPLSALRSAGIVSLILDSILVDGLEFIELMNGCRNLEELALSGVAVDPWCVSIRRRWSSLRTLSLAQNHSDTLSLLFASYETPNLKTIKFDVPIVPGVPLGTGWDLSDDTDDDLYNVSLASCLRLFRCFLKDASSVEALTLGCDVDQMHHILKILWPHSSYSGEYLPYLSDLTILTRRPIPVQEAGSTDCQWLIETFVEERQSASRSLQRLTVPRYLLEKDIDWMQGHIEELELPHNYHPWSDTWYAAFGVNRWSE